MKIKRSHIVLISSVILLTTILSWFYYAHETLPKPLRALTALLETPVAIASGISHYLNLGISVYESMFAVIVVNFIFSLLISLLVYKIIIKKSFK
jgi:hypothetical protein